MIKHVCGHAGADMPFRSAPMYVSGSVGLDAAGRLTRVGTIVLDLPLVAQLAKAEAMPVVLTCPKCGKEGQLGNEFMGVAVCVFTGKEGAAQVALSDNISAAIAPAAVAEVEEFLRTAPTLMGV